MNELVRLIADARERAAAIQSGAPQKDERALMLVLEELNNSLEELSVADEEIREQHERLLESRDAVEMHRQRYEDLFGLAPDGYVVTDRSGIIQEVNRAFASMLRLVAEDLIGRPFVVFVPEEDRSKFQSALLSLHDEHLIKDWELTLSSSHRPAFIANTAIWRVEGWTGHGIRFLWMIRDVTDWKRIEAEQTELKIAYHRERRIAEALQRWLLETPNEEAFPGLRVTTSYEAAFEESRIGGDFYDAFALPGGRTGLVVGDVSGKGLSAAIHTAELRFAFRHIIREGASPEEALARANDLLYAAQDLDGEQRPHFATASVVVIDGVSGDGRFACAGCGALVLRRDGEEELARAAGIPLGLFERQEYLNAAVQLESGDLLVLATDGVSEARSGAQMLGWEGAVKIARAAQSLEGPAPIARTILEGARAFCGGVLQDDACVLAAQRK